MKPSLLLEILPPADLDYLRDFLNSGVDGVFIPDNPLGKVSVDSIVSALRIQEEFGVPAYAAVALGSKSAAYALSRIVTARIFGVHGIVIVSGDDKSCAGRLKVLDAIRYARTPVEADKPGYVRGLKDAILRSRKYTKIGAVVDVRSEVSYRLAYKKIAAGVQFFLTQMLAEPARYTDRILALAEKLEVYVGVPYVASRSRTVEALLGGGLPDKKGVLSSLRSLLVKARSRGLELGVYVSAIGQRRGLREFLADLRELME